MSTREAALAAADRAHWTEKEALLEQFDNGEITRERYQILKAQADARLQSVFDNVATLHVPTNQMNTEEAALAAAGEAHKREKAALLDKFNNGEMFRERYEMLKAQADERLQKAELMIHLYGRIDPTPSDIARVRSAKREFSLCTCPSMRKGQEIKYLDHGTTATVYSICEPSEWARYIIKCFDRGGKTVKRSNFSKESDVHVELRRRRDKLAESRVALNLICISQRECNKHCSMYQPCITGAKLEKRMLDFSLPSLKNNRRIAIELLKIIYDAHSVGFSHGDFKAKNIVLPAVDAHPIVVDLGEGQFFDPTGNPFDRRKLFEEGLEPVSRDGKQLLWVVLQLRFGLPFIAENDLPSLMRWDEETKQYDLEEVFYVLCGTSFYCDDDPFAQTLLPGVARVILALFPAPDEPDVQIKRMTGWKFRHLKAAAKSIHEMHRRNIKRIEDTDGDIDEAVTRQVKQACSDALNYFSIQLREVCSLSDAEVKAHCEKIVAQAKEFQEEIAPHFHVKGFWEKLGEMVLDFLNSIPIVGHIKGIVHYAMGDTEAGNAAMIAATRSVFVAASAIYCGGAVGALIAGAAFDTAVASIKAGAFQLGGIAAVSVEIVRKVIDGENILGDLKGLAVGVGCDVALGLLMKPISQPFDQLVNKGLSSAMGRGVKPVKAAADRIKGGVAGKGRGGAPRRADGGHHREVRRRAPGDGGNDRGNNGGSRGAGGGDGGGGGGGGEGGGGDGNHLHLELPDHADFVDDNKFNRGGDVLPRNRDLVPVRKLRPGGHKAGDPFQLDGDIRVHPAYGDHPVAVHTEAYHALADGRSPAHPDFTVDVSQLTPLQKVRAQLFHRKAARSKSYMADPGHDKQIRNLEDRVRKAEAPDGGEAFAFKHMAGKEFGDDWGTPADAAAQKEAAAQFKNIRDH